MDCWATTPDAMPLEPSSRRRAPGKSGTDSGAASGLWALALSWMRHMAVATMLGSCKLGGEVEGCATAPKASSAAVSLRLGHLPPPSPPPLLDQRRWDILTHLRHRGSKGPELLVGWWLVQAPLGGSVPFPPLGRIIVGLVRVITQWRNGVLLRQRWPWLQRGLLLWRPAERGAWCWGCSPSWVLGPHGGKLRSRPWPQVLGPGPEWLAAAGRTAAAAKEARAAVPGWG